MNHKAAVRARTDTLPPAVWDCEGCGKTDTMAIRRSSLNEPFYADDVMLKCMTCWNTRTHGIPFDDPDEFERELAARETRTIDFARDGHNPAEQLAALGYTGKSEVVR